MKFFEKWNELENCQAKIILKHSLFGRQMHNCDALRVINDDRIGLTLKGQDVFMAKQDIIQTEMHDGIYMVSDGRLTITVFCK